jgi:hypothetical protein
MKDMKKNKFFNITTGALLLLFTTMEAHTLLKVKPAPRYGISGEASGSQMVPMVSSAATGTLSGIYDSETNMLTYTINWSGLTADALEARLHGPAAAGSNAAVIQTLAITKNGSTGIASGSITISDSLETQLLAGRLYYVLPTMTNSGGEIRGQISAQKVE